MTCEDDMQKCKKCNSIAQKKPRKTPKIALLLPLLPLLLGILGLLFFMHKPHFSVKKISSNRPLETKWQHSEVFSEDIKQILSQPYHYLGSGAQCYAFASDDGKYVIKFFKMKHLLPDTLSRFFPFGKYKNRNQRHEERLRNTLEACRIAYEELREETGLIFAHINPSKSLKQKIVLQDKFGNKNVVELDKTSFLLQHRAELVYERMGRMIRNGDLIGAKKAFKAIIDLVEKRNQKGFCDDDTGISRNYGFIDEKPIHLDFLRIVRTSDTQEPQRFRQRMLEWIAKHYPEVDLAADIQDCNELT